MQLAINWYYACPLHDHAKSWRHTHIDIIICLLPIKIIIKHKIIIACSPFVFSVRVPLFFSPVHAYLKRILTLSRGFQSIHKSYVKTEMDVWNWLKLNYFFGRHRLTISVRTKNVWTAFTAFSYSNQSNQSKGMRALSLEQSFLSIDSFLNCNQTNFLMF